MRRTLCVFVLQLAEVGPCSNETLLDEGDYIFADNWCPFSAAWVIIFGFSIFVFWFALGPVRVTYTTVDVYK